MNFTDFQQPQIHCRLKIMRELRIIDCPKGFEIMPAGLPAINPLRQGVIRNSDFVVVSPTKGHPNGCLFVWAPAAL